MKTFSKTLTKILGRPAAEKPQTNRSGSNLPGKTGGQARRESRAWAWWATAAVGGLLLAILVAGLLGLLLNRSIQQAVDVASYDVELEDHGDDLRVAVLDLRHYHRDLLLYEPTPERVAAFDEAYADLHQEIDELEDLGVDTHEVPQPPEIRATAEAYYEDLRPAIGLYDSEPQAFERASDRGLERIEDMEAAAAQIDDHAERHAEDELGLVDGASSRATVVLIVTVSALLLAGVALAYLALRVVGELRTLYARQKEAAEAKTEFLADVSHELRTPLTVLRGNAEVGLALEGNCPHRDILEEIVGESSRMTRMVEGPLFLARSDSAAPVEMLDVRIDDFLEEIDSRANALARERGAVLLTDLSGEGELTMDRRRLAQAVLILVDNAAKYGARGSDDREATIRLTSALNTGELLIEVADEGPGIPEEELSKIFERFYRLDKARSRSMGGAGLGLPIARTIVEAHDGHIEAESTPGEGTLMRIWLPAPSSWRKGPDTQDESTSDTDDQGPSGDTPAGRSLTEP